MSFSSSKSSLNNSSNPSNSLEEGIFNSIGLGSKASSLNRNSSLSTTENSTFSFVTNILTGIIVVILIILLVINGLQYYFGINVIEKLKDLFSKKPQVEIKMVKRDDKEDDEGKDDDDKIIKIIRKPVIKQQVFNIPGNYFNYTDAKSLCKAEGARLATYSEVEDAYNNGAEWCNYGWSEGQMALFPTQKTSYDKLQKIEGHEKDCGRPGVNGGYIENPNLQYGANCYGYKPRMTKEEEDLMNTSTPYPKSEKDLEMERRVNYWKTRLDDILVSPFNYQSWSRV
uniref:Link domain-containing protein n=1 Tax=viral metagenome TaxID=1070528 RepID=A0A6C0BV78_9ZZZZ